MGVAVTRVVKFIRKGTGISRTDVEYADSTSNSVAPTSGWTTNAPAWQNGHYIWQRVRFIYTDGTDGYSNPVCLSGGKGISKIEEYYLATSASSGVTTATQGWTKAVQSVTATNKYLWNYEVVTYTDGTTTTTTPIIIGTYGDKGVGISSITEYYLATSASSGVTRSTSGWTTTVQSVTATKKYLWNYETVTYTDGSTANTDPVIIGVYGDKGDTGNGISSVVEYYLASSSSSGVTTSTTGWTTDPTATAATMTKTKKYLWNYERINYTDGTHVDTTPAIIGRFGDTGVGISSITEYYLATSASSGVTRSTSGWTTTVQSVTATKKYLWNYETVTYTDGSTANTDPVIIGVYGDKGDTGNGISSVVEYYLASSSSSGVTTSTTGWTTDPTATAATMTKTKKYLWNYERINYTDGTHVDTTPAIIGRFGDTGVGISSITEYYLATSASSGVTRSTSGWTTTVQSVTATKKYLWNYETVTYTDGSTANTDPVIIGVYGDKGDTGNGISSVVEYYLASSSSSGVTTSTTGWTTDPTATAATMTKTKKYLWNYERINYTDGTHVDTTPAIIGRFGDTGVGISSITEYYLATSASSGVTRSTSGWTTTVQSVTATKKYLWNYETVTYTDGSTANTDPVIIGVYGDKGDTGNGISSVVEYYLASSSSSGVTTSTTGWTTDPTATAATMTKTKKYLWNYERINYTDGTHVDTTPAIIGRFGDTGVGISSITEYYLATSASSGVTRSTSGWTTTVQSVTATKKYLWNYETVTYTDGSTANTDPVIIGVYGDKGDQGNKGDNAVTYSISLAGSVFYRDPNTDTIYVDIKGKVYRNEGGNTYAQSLNRTDLSLYFLKEDDTQDSIPNVNNINNGYTVNGSTFATKFYNNSGYASEKAFVAVLSIDGVERARESIQITKNGGTGSQGPRGYRGPALRGPQDWAQMDNGYQFYKGDADYIEPYEDFVIYNGNYYKCIKTHTKTSTNYPGSTYDTSNNLWELTTKVGLVAANILFGDHGYFGSAIISGDWMISTNGVIDGVNYTKNDRYNNQIPYSLFNGNNPGGNPITKFNGAGPYTLAASDTTKGISTVTLEEGKTYKLTATGKCGSSSGSYYIRLRYGINGATYTPVMINGTSNVTRSGLFTVNASGTYYLEFYNSSGLTGTVTNVVLAEMNFAPVFALDLLTGKTYQNDAVIKGSIYRPPLIVNDSNYTTYAPKNYAGCYIVDISKTGLNVQLNFEVNSGTLLIDFPSASLYQGAELTVMNCSNVTAYVESVLWGAGDASFPIKQGGGYAVFKSTKYSNNNWVWFPIAEIHDPYYD